MKKTESEIKAKEIVISFQETLNIRDLKSARSYVSDNFLCTNPLGSYDGAEAYFKAVEKAGQAHQIPFKFDIKKIFTDGNDVCVFNDVIAGSITLLACEWYRVEDQKIRSLKLVYDPRPLIQRNDKY